MTKRNDQEVTYAYRYLVEPWNRPIEGETLSYSDDGLIRRMKGNYGYTDNFFLITMLEGSWMLFDTRAPNNTPSRPTVTQLTEVRDYLTHLIEKHALEFPE